MKRYTIDEEIKQINLFDERFYNIKVGKKEYDVFNVTGWLEAFPKGNGFKQWLINTKDPDAVRDEAAQLGSDIHRLIELTLLGDTVKYIEGQTRLEVWERYLGWCGFWKELQTDPNKLLGLKKVKEIQAVPEFTEFITYDIDYNYAGTVDKMIKIVFEDGSVKFAILDWKTGNNIYDTAYIQVSAYIKSVEKQHGVKDVLGYIVQVNQSLNKKGYRVHKVENPNEEFEIFLATQKLYLRANGEPKPKYKYYPMEMNLENINKIGA